jgi:hypothetical protein
MGSDWTEEAVAAAVARLEAQGVRQDVPAKLRAKTAPARKRPQAPAGEAEAPIGTEAGMHALWRAALEAHGADLPPALPEYEFAAPWRAWRFDYAWPHARVAVELDGMAWQAGGGHHNTDGDRLKMNSAAALGWRALRFTSKALRTEPAACVALLRRALEPAP